MIILKYQGEGERIDKWLTKQFPYSRNFFHHIISRNGIMINGKKIKKSHQLKNNDNIKIDDINRYLSPVILDEAPKIDIPIILEKEDFLVINKPKGILSHPNSVREVSHPSVVGFLYHNYKNLPSIGNFIRAGLIHRLDKETDGLMIIAKTEKGLSFFKNLFQEKSENKTIKEKEQGKLKKYYRAICYINPDGQKFIDQINQLPYYIQEYVIAKMPHCEPKVGITKIIKIIKDKYVKTNNEDNNLIKLKGSIGFELEILTGRTHQIRYHLSHHGLPIVGDYLYGKEENIPMQLTAYKLIFSDLDGKMIELEI